MLATLVAALSLAASVPAMDVPYLPQTDALCGGAAAAMVFRYGETRTPTCRSSRRSVDRRAGGIANGVLVDASGRAGWQRRADRRGCARRA